MHRFGMCSNCVLNLLPITLDRAKYQYISIVMVDDWNYMTAGMSKILKEFGRIYIPCIVV